MVNAINIRIVKNARGYKVGKTLRVEPNYGKSLIDKGIAEDVSGVYVKKEEKVPKKGTKIEESK